MPLERPKRKETTAGTLELSAEACDCAWKLELAFIPAWKPWAKFRMNCSYSSLDAAFEFEDAPESAVPGALAGGAMKLPNRFMIIR